MVTDLWQDRLDRWADGTGSSTGKRKRWWTDAT